MHNSKQKFCPNGNHRGVWLEPHSGDFECIGCRFAVRFSYWPDRILNEDESRFMDAVWDKIKSFGFTNPIDALAAHDHLRRWTYGHRYKDNRSKLVGPDGTKNFNGFTVETFQLHNDNVYQDRKTFIKKDGFYAQEGIRITF